jgi:GST-like protein
MSDENIWTPPANIEALFGATAGNQFAAINAPTSGAREEVTLPEGAAPFQLYSLATPNGNKVSILLEELVDLGLLEYDAHKIMIGKGEQFGSGFVSVNPNSKIPSAVDKAPLDGGAPIRLFESTSIALYLADKYDKFSFKNDPRLRQELLNWLFFQHGGQGPMTGNFGHFFVYAPDEKKETRDYGTARYGMDVLRITDVLEKHLAGKEWIVGGEYSLADIILYPWYRQITVGYPHKSGIKAAEFLGIAEKFPNCNAWADRIFARDAVKRGVQVCTWTSEHTKPWLHEEEAK